MVLLHRGVSTGLRGAAERGGGSAGVIARSASAIGAALKEGETAARPGEGCQGAWTAGRPREGGVCVFLDFLYTRPAKVRRGPLKTGPHERPLGGPTARVGHAGAPSLAHAAAGRGFHEFARARGLRQSIAACFDPDAPQWPPCFRRNQHSWDSCLGQGSEQLWRWKAAHRRLPPFTILMISLPDQFFFC